MIQQSEIITKELLINKGWLLKENNWIKSMVPEEMKLLEDQGISFDWSEYDLRVENTNHTQYDGFWFITMRYNISNTPNRDWSCFIDNCSRDGVASVDIGTVEQFNKLMELMDIEYRL